MQQTSKRWHSLGIIDIHGHIGHFQGFAIGKETLIANVEKYGIKTCLVSNIDCANMPGLTANLNPEQANAKTVELVESNPETFRGLLWVRPTTQDLNSARHFLEMRTGALSQKRLFVGMKFHPEFDHYPADDKSVDGFLDLCAANGVPAVFHCGQPGSNSDAARIYLAAKRHPKVPIVLYHMGFRSDHSSAIEIVASACKNKDANLYLETSQCPPEIVLSAIKSVGASRVLFGTDATYYGYNHYEAYIPMLDLLQQKLSPVDFNRVIRDNATKLFPL